MLAVERLARGRLHYGWIIAVVTFVTLLSAAGIRSTPGVLIIPLEKEFGWSRAMISVALSVLHANLHHGHRRIARVPPNQLTGSQECSSLQPRRTQDRVHF